MKTTLIVLIITLYVMVFTIGYFIIEYANVNNIKLKQENQFLSERVEQLLVENNSLREEIISIKEMSDLKYYYIFWTSFVVFIIFLFLYYLFIKHFTK